MVNLYIKQVFNNEGMFQWTFMGQFSRYDTALLAGKKLAVLLEDIRIYNV